MSICERLGLGEFDAEAWVEKWVDFMDDNPGWKLTGWEEQQLLAQLLQAAYDAGRAAGRGEVYERAAELNL